MLVPSASRRAVMLTHGNPVHYRVVRLLIVFVHHGVAARSCNLHDVMHMDVELFLWINDVLEFRGKNINYGDSFVQEGDVGLREPMRRFDEYLVKIYRSACMQTAMNGCTDREKRLELLEDQPFLERKLVSSEASLACLVVTSPCEQPLDCRPKRKGTRDTIGQRVPSG